MSNPVLANCLRQGGLFYVCQQEATSYKSCWHHTYIQLRQLTVLPSSALPRLRPLDSQPCASFPVFGFPLPPVPGIVSHSMTLWVAFYL